MDVCVEAINLIILPQIDFYYNDAADAVAMMISTRAEVKKDEITACIRREMTSGDRKIILLYVTRQKVFRLAAAKFS